MGQGKSRSEARGHPWWEPEARAHPPAKGKQKYRRPDVLAGRPGHCGEDLPPSAALRALRAYTRTFGHQSNVLVAVHGRPVAFPKQGMSPRIRDRVRQAQQAPEPCIWAGSTVLPTAVLRAHLEAGASLADIFGAVPGLPMMETVDQIELSVPA